ncbi:MAG: type IV pilus assembly protein PilM, partial [Armatimonadetes bacterium]|nr:type IV pilus assembly protein PilM [Armatimonadota bacterium]
RTMQGRGRIVLSHRTNDRLANRIGLDIGSHAVKGVEVFEHGSEIVVRSVGSAIIARGESTEGPPAAATVQAIRSLWSSAQFQSKSVVLAMPTHAVYTKWLHIEAADEDELEQTALAAAARGAPFPASDAITEMRVLSSRSTGSHTSYFVMLVAVSSSALDLMLDMVEMAGLEPIAVDIASAAALRCFGTQKKNVGPLWSDQPQAHCIIGACETTIAVVRGDALEFSRTVPVGGNDFTTCLEEHTGLSWPEAEMLKSGSGTRLNANGTMDVIGNEGELLIPCDNVAGRLAREIQRSLRFFTSQFAEGSYLGMIGATTLSGGGALLRGIDACLGTQGIDVAGVINPFAGLSVAADAAGIQRVGDHTPTYTTAVGLAIGDYWSGIRTAISRIAA